MPTMSVIVQSCVPQEMLGVATSGRQFFMQIGQVMGVAIFGLVFTTTYGSAFTKDISEETRAAIPANVATDFQDPTSRSTRRGSTRRSRRCSHYQAARACSMTP